MMFPWEIQVTIQALFNYAEHFQVIVIEVLPAIDSKKLTYTIIIVFVIYMMISSLGTFSVIKTNRSLSYIFYIMCSETSNSQGAHGLKCLIEVELLQN